MGRWRSPGTSETRGFHWSDTHGRNARKADGSAKKKKKSTSTTTHAKLTGRNSRFGKVKHTRAGNTKPTKVFSGDRSSRFVSPAGVDLERAFWRGRVGGRGRSVVGDLFSL